VQERSSVRYCGTTPMQRRARAGPLRTSIPAIDTSPAVGNVRVVQIPMVVVLPAPLGPRSPNNSPRLTQRLIASSATTGVLPGRLSALRRVRPCCPSSGTREVHRNLRSASNAPAVVDLRIIILRWQDFYSVRDTSIWSDLDGQTVAPAIFALRNRLHLVP